MNEPERNTISFSSKLEVVADQVDVYLFVEEITKHPQLLVTDQY